MDFYGLLKICRWEPDICVGWEIQMFSWGYLLQRAAHLNVDLCAQISRIPGENFIKHKTSFMFTRRIRNCHPSQEDCNAVSNFYLTTGIV